MKNVIENHVAKLDKLELEIEEFIVKEILKISVEGVIQDPETELSSFAETVLSELEGNYYERSVEAGFDLFKNVKERHD